MVLGEHGKLDENKKRDKYLELARELKNLWDVKVMEISIVISALGKSSTGWYRNWWT